MTNAPWPPGGEHPGGRGVGPEDATRNTHSRPELRHWNVIADGCPHSALRKGSRVDRKRTSAAPDLDADVREFRRSNHDASAFDRPCTHKAVARLKSVDRNAAPGRLT